MRRADAPPLRYDSGALDGMEPAWSPDVGTIAFTRVERMDSITTDCQETRVTGPRDIFSLELAP